MEEEFPSIEELAELLESKCKSRKEAIKLTAQWIERVRYAVERARLRYE